MKELLSAFGVLLLYLVGLASGTTAAVVLYHDGHIVVTSIVSGLLVVTVIAFVMIVGSLWSDR